MQSSTKADRDVMKAISMLTTRVEKLSTNFQKAKDKSNLQETKDEKIPSKPANDSTLPTILPYITHAPFPQRLAKARLENNMGRSFIVTEVPSFARFLKDLTTNRNKTEGVVNLFEQCIAIILKQLLPKLEDLSNFSIPISIDSLVVYNALYDLGASVSLMPFLFTKNYKNEGSLLQTSMTLQLVIEVLGIPRVL
ncbi:uncharacterized protein LOC130818535 [Amaranthus tricolor]|uniref:uncharacterized protein LOC130818535 n=1 Tax=Amaranthus tricolor TaxID=29722 RepID=UPI002584E006|nr:uncharacterized protein LOC130818535 [Amaranthus tricolor]